MNVPLLACAAAYLSGNSFALKYDALPSVGRKYEVTPLSKYLRVKAIKEKGVKEKDDY